MPPERPRFADRLLAYLAALAERSIDRPRRTLFTLAVVTLLAAPGLLRLELRTDGHALVPPSDPAVRFDAEVRQHFQLRDMVVAAVVTEHPAGIYNPATLQAVADLAAALSGLEDIGRRQVQSLATERRERLAEGRSGTYTTFLRPFPDRPELLEQLREDLGRASAGIFTGTLVSAERRVAAVVVGVPARESGEPRTVRDRTAVVRRLLAAADQVATSATDRILVVGAPIAEVLLGEHILEDLARLMPLVLAGIAAVIWIGCRRLWGVVLALGEVAACLVWTFGLMGWLRVPVYLPTAVLPIVLTTIALADEIHIFWCYQRQLATSLPHDAAVRSTLRQMVRPVVLTSFTTAVGFLSFVVSPVLPVRWFGVFAAVGILFAMIWSLTVIPASLALLPPQRLRLPTRQARGLPRWVQRAARGMLERRRFALGTLVLVSVLAVWAAREVEVQDGWIRGFAAGSPFRRATEEINAHLFGSHVLLVHLSFEPPEVGSEPAGRQRTLLEPEVVDALGEFEAFAARRPETGGALGLHSYLTAMAYFWKFAQPGDARTLPTDVRNMTRLVRRLEFSRGPGRRRELIDDASQRTVLTVFLKNANYRETARLMADLRARAEETLAPLGLRLGFAGDVAVSQAMIPAIVRTQISSLLLALTGAFCVVSFFHRSAAVGFFAVLPASVAVLWVFGVMGLLEVDLGVATSMYCAITLGIGIDFAIHFLERFRDDPAAEVRERVLSALVLAGPAILTDTLAITFGFGVLGLSQVPANAALGLLVSLALMASCVLSLVGLASLLATWAPRFD